MINRYWYISLGSCIIGILFFFIAHEWIILRFPMHYKSIDQSSLAQKKEKTVQLIFWHNQRWHNETETIVWSNNKNEALESLLSRWINLLHEEKLLTHTTSIQTVLISKHNETAYISFTHNPLCTNFATYDNILFIEGLLRTIRKSNLSIKHIALLVNHTSLENDHLDFTKPWPINGFVL